MYLLIYIYVCVRRHTHESNHSMHTLFYLKTPSINALYDLYLTHPLYFFPRFFKTPYKTLRSLFFILLALAQTTNE